MEDRAKPDGIFSLWGVWCCLRSFLDMVHIVKLNVLVEGYPGIAQAYSRFMVGIEDFSHHLFTMTATLIKTKRTTGHAM
jgi:hypothetical protein